MEKYEIQEVYFMEKLFQIMNKYGVEMKKDNENKIFFLDKYGNFCLSIDSIFDELTNVERTEEILKTAKFVRSGVLFGWEQDV